MSFFKYSYKASIIISKDKALVWSVLTDLEKYNEWNAFTPRVVTDWSIGEKVILTVQMKNDQKPIKQIEYLSKYEPESELAWGISWGPFLKAERVQKLTSTPEGGTNYYTEDVIFGALSPIVNLLYGSSIQKGFNSLASSLKTYVERL